MRTKILLLLLGAVLAAPVPVQARVKLVALPERARVVVSLSNPTATLIEEERLITLQKGVNKVDFSWRGVNLDGVGNQRAPARDRDGLAAARSALRPRRFRLPARPCRSARPSGIAATGR